MISFVLFGVLLCFSFFSARLLFQLQSEKYQNPSLHEGRWGPPELAGQGGQVRVVWHRKPSEGYSGWLRDAATHKRHEPYRCTIGPGMAHVDECLCGATRSGVFGAWSSRRI